MPAPTIRVLVADPDADIRRRVSKVVRTVADAADLEVAIDQASDGTTALAALADHRPRLVIAEILLGGISGLSLMRRIRSEHGDATAVVLLTALSSDSDRYWGLRNGAHAYVTKPFDDARFAERIRPLVVDGPKAKPERPF
jgi:DNA-binding response OmpR family regulator